MNPIAAARCAVDLRFPPEGLHAAAWLAAPTANRARSSATRLKYQRSTSTARERMRAEWNEPVTWPLALWRRCCLHVRLAGGAALSPARAPDSARGRRSGGLSASMLAYLVRRVLYALPILIGVNLITFALFFVVNTPDDMARMQLGVKRVTPEAIERWKAERGYDKPLFFNADKPRQRQAHRHHLLRQVGAHVRLRFRHAPTTAATSRARSACAWGRRWPLRCRPSCSACS